ncbi:MAG: flagellar motor protein MotB [Pseudomonadota bacterium]
MAYPGRTQVGTQSGAQMRAHAYANPGEAPTRGGSAGRVSSSLASSPASTPSSLTRSQRSASVSPRVQRARRGGTWLITYADLMTILVCFFVLIVSFSIQDQVKLEVVAGSMRDAFGVAEERRFAGDVKMIGTPDQRQPGNVRPSPTPTASAITETLSANPAAGNTGHAGAYEQREDAQKLRRRVTQAFDRAILTHPLLKDQSDAITITLVEDGLQVVLADSDGLAMFLPGQAEPTPRARLLLTELSRILQPLPNRITIEGHADAAGQGAYSAFALTVTRADNARQILQGAGLDEARISAVTGRGADKPLYPDDPYAAGNRRIEILLEPAAPLLPPNRSL